MNAIRKKKLPSKPETSSQEKEVLWKMCCRCWHHSPELRSTAKYEASVLLQLINVDKSLHLVEGTEHESQNKIRPKLDPEDYLTLFRLFTAVTNAIFPGWYVLALKHALEPWY